MGSIKREVSIATSCFTQNPMRKKRQPGKSCWGRAALTVYNKDGGLGYLF